MSNRIHICFSMELKMLTKNKYTQSKEFMNYKKKKYK